MSVVCNVKLISINYVRANQIKVSFTTMAGDANGSLLVSAVDGKVLGPKIGEMVKMTIE